MGGQLRISWLEGLAADCHKDVLIITQDEIEQQRPEAVTRRKTELTKEDRQKLEKLALPATEWEDDASIMAARISLDCRLKLVGVERSLSWEMLTKKRILRRIERLLKRTMKPGVIICYYGPGKLHTGDWCFGDGFITFREIASLYREHYRGCILEIHTDCSYSGHWVTACEEFLDEHGVLPCGHSGNEKGILLSVTSSCWRAEVPYCLLYTIRAMVNDKNTGTLTSLAEGCQLSANQHLRKVSTLQITCESKSIDNPCTLRPDYTWRKKREANRVYLVTGMDSERGCPVWHYVMLVDDEVIVEMFKEAVKQGRVDVREYGQVLESGQGEDPPNEVKDRMEREYCKVYR